MKASIIISVLMSILTLRQPSPHAFEGFVNHVMNEIKIPPEKQKNICEWQYAIIKIQCDKYNRTVSYEVLNPVPDEIKNAIRTLKKYTFNKNIAIQQHPIVMCMVFENENTDCVLKSAEVLPTQVLEKIFGQFYMQQEKDPKTLIIHQIPKHVIYEAIR